MAAVNLVIRASEPPPPPHPPPGLIGLKFQLHIIRFDNLAFPIFSIAEDSISTCYIKPPIKAAVYVPNTQKVLLITSKTVWQLNKTTFFADTGFPKPLPSYFQDMNSPPDAAVYTPEPYPNGAIYLFKGDKVWQYDLDENGIPHPYVNPFPIVEKWAYLPSDLDACMYMDNEVNCVKGNNHYKGPAPLGTIVPIIAKWNNDIPNDIQASYLDEDSNVAYFFKDFRYHRYDRNKIQADATAGSNKCISGLVKIYGKYNTVFAFP